MRNTTKKGVTIVELVIVIAVIAILAAVLIPTFSNLIKKANLSNDQTTIAMINKNLQTEYVTTKPASASEVIQKLYSLGFTEEKLVSYGNGYHYVYDLEDNQFYLTDTDGSIVFPEDKTDKTNMWGLYRDGGKNDIVDGVVNYVFIVSPTNHYNYASAFSDGKAHTLDLNGSVLRFSTEYVAEAGSSAENRADNDDKITIQNGAIVGDLDHYIGSNGEAESGVTKYTLAENESVYSGLTGVGELTDSGVLTFENYSFVGKGNADNNTLQAAYTELASSVNASRTGEQHSDNPVKKVVFKNCIFAEYNSFTPFGAEPKKGNTKYAPVEEIVFENCKFVNVGTAISCNSKDNKCVLKVTGCEFTNCESGISIRQPAAGSVISNNTFNIVGTGSIHGQAIQLYDVSIPTGNTTPLITISNNTIAYAQSFIRLNSISNFASTDWVNFVKFENNSFPSGLTKVMDGSAEHKTAVEALIK